MKLIPRMETELVIYETEVVEMDGAVEKLKKMRKTVDVLTLTATPIPRTLNMAMAGIRDLSIISSPPEGRLAIRTQLAKFNEETVRDAVMRELRRGGPRP